MKRFLILLTIILLVFYLFGLLKKKSRGSDFSVVPLSYQATYKKLEEELTAFDKYLESQKKSKKAEVIFGAELLTANGNRGEALLTSKGYEENLLYLDKLKSLGVAGVTIAIPYPLLSDDFPRSSEYLSFYKKITQEIRKRDLKLLVKMGVVFPQKEFSNLSFNPQKVSLEEYFKEKKRYVKLIIQEIGPDYLTICNEPTTERQLLKKKISAERYTQFIKETLKGLDRGKTLLGGGSGSWEEIDFIESYAGSTDLDYIDIHIYPLGSLGKNYLMSALRMTKIAQKFGKKVVIGEFWLYKTTGLDFLRGVVAPDLMARDVFSFWEPLDLKMLEVVAKLAETENIEYISPFWTKYFFSYLDFNSQTKYRRPGELLREADIKAFESIIDDKFTETGLGYKRLIQEKGK